MSEADQSAPLLQPARPKKTDCEPCTVGAPLYMATFSDMAILLMAFFVLLLSMTEIDLKTWQKITGQIRLAFGTQSINLDLTIPTARSMIIDDFSPNEAAREITLDVRQRMETEGELIVRNTETYQNQFDIEREFLILEASLESEIERGEVIVKIQDEQLVVEVPETSRSAGSGEGQSEDRSGIINQQLINVSAKVAQIQSEITRDINVFAIRESSIESNEDSTAKLLNKLQALRENLRTEVENDLLEVEMRDDAIYITVDGDDSFASGSAELRPNFVVLLGEIGRSIAGLTDSIAIEGHTDNIPIAFRDRFQSNWDLSAARASSVATTLMSQPSLEDIQYEVLGFADTVPVASNDTAQGRSQNRRIEIKMSDFN
ncbi:MAG: flagellar motor protein [Gammaproteobacteria bacterium TMED163]|nr:MAG: flagellar motor protein [Gammaproteobacteria bacterium TMED163]